MPMPPAESNTDSLQDLLLTSIPAARDDNRAIDYVNQLTALPLSTLAAEPVNLSSEAAVLTSSLSNLCLNECDTFLSLQSVSASIETSLTAFDKGISSLLQLIPCLESAAHQFQSEARAIKEERKETLAVMEQQEKLLGILELPQLIDTCVRNSYHQEALDLLNHTRKLVSIYPDNRYVREVEKEIDLAIQYMTTQLFNGLRGNVKLPAVFKSINFLRRLQVLEEDELALAFLSFRLEFLEGHLNYILTDLEDPSKCLKRYIDAWREGINDIVMQFESLFLKECSNERVGTVREMLAALLNRLLEGLFKVLDSKLHLVNEPNSLTSLMTQLSFCSVSFSKIGMDFRPLIVPLYEKAVLDLINEALSKTSHEFAAVIDEGIKEAQLPSKIFANAGEPLDEHVFERPFTAQSPPPGLTAIPPLARYVNAVIVTMNNLRLLAPVGLMVDVVGCYDASLAVCIQSLLRFAQNWDSQDESRMLDKDRERDLVRVVGRAVLDLLIPFVRKALVEGVFGGATESPSLGDLVRSDEVSENDHQLTVAVAAWREWSASGPESSS
jgi:hypothetical protein